MVAQSVDREFHLHRPELIERHVAEEPASSADLDSLADRVGAQFARERSIVFGARFRPACSIIQRSKKSANAAGAGVFAAISGFSKGGAGGALQGAGAALGTAALFDPEPISKGILAGTALVTSLLGGFLNNPARRANAINTELGQQQYNAPTALNVTQSSGGTFADFDYRGNLRTSNFSPYPQVSEGYTWEQTHGLFDGPPTFYQVPGGQKSQFGAPVSPSVVNNHYWTVNAMDSESFNDFAQRNHMAIGNAAARNVQQVEGSLSAEINRKIRGG